MKVGDKHKKTVEVVFENTAAAVGNPGFEVFSTPEMLLLIEMTCKEMTDASVGKGSVGTYIDMKHKGATPIGMHVTCEVELIEMEGSKLTFSAKLYDELEEVGSAKHGRYLTDLDKFMERTKAKKEKFKNL